MWSFLTPPPLFWKMSKIFPIFNYETSPKAFKSSSTISGGMITVTCGHKITKGFRLIEKGESPQLFLHSIFQRLPSNEKAKNMVMIYDFACMMHKCALRRFPFKIRRFKLVIDSHHQANHTVCSEAYSMSCYP